MKGVDTNILIRFLVGDDEAQATKVYKIFKQTESEQKVLYVTLLVVLEMIWVLESVYEISRAKILESIGDLLLMPILKFEKIEAVQQFLLNARGNRQDLSDLLIAHSAKESGCRTLLTFDKKASKSSLFEIVNF